MKTFVKGLVTTLRLSKHAKGAIIFFRMGVLMHKLGVTKSFY